MAMKFEDLPQADQDGILEAAAFVRDATGKFQRLAAFLKALRSGRASKSINDAMSKLDPDMLIPNKTGLAGAGAITPAQWLRLLQLADDLVALNTAEVYDICVCAAGPVNCMGQ